MLSHSIFNKKSDELMPADVSARHRDDFFGSARKIYVEHLSQNSSDVKKLKEKYSKGRVGKMKVFDALMLLGQCIDPSDADLFCTSQLNHALQTAEYLYDAGHGPQMIALGLIHDIGKILLLAGEDPANVVCPNEPIGNFDIGCGLDSVTVTWNHDEYAFDKLKGFLPPEYAWLIRFHSLRFDKAEMYMNENDRRLYQSILLPFREADLRSKCLWYKPRRGLDFYKTLIDSMFPRAIEF